MKTSRMRPQDAPRQWVVINAENKILGRVAQDVATILMGKNKTSYQPDIEMGDHVVVINVDKIQVTGRKLDDKIYYHHTLHIGGLKSISLRKQMAIHPDRPLRDAVRGMLPKNKLRDRLMTRLHIYAGGQHPHIAQVPVAMETAFSKSS